MSFIRRGGAAGDGGVMDLHFSREDMIFRDQARTWLRDNLVRERRPHSGEAMRSFDLAWQRKQFEGGWAGVSWPTEYGGLGLSLPRQLILHEGYSRAQTPHHHLCFVVLNHSGPALMASGSAYRTRRQSPQIYKA